MSSKTTWDMGDVEPEGITLVRSLEVDSEVVGGGLILAKTVHGEWKGYDRGGKVYLSWDELVRRYGPVEAVSL